MKISPKDHQIAEAWLREYQRPKCVPDCPVCNGTGFVSTLDPNTYNTIGKQPCPRIPKPQ